MDEPNDEESGATAVDKLRGFLDSQLKELEDPRNVHKVRERLFGRRWADEVDLEDLEEGVAESVTRDVERAWAALSRYPWDLYGAQQALKSAMGGLAP